jgi:hypothetical protein
MATAGHPDKCRRSVPRTARWRLRPSAADRLLKTSRRPRYEEESPDAGPPDAGHDAALRPTRRCLAHRGRAAPGPVGERGPTPSGPSATAGRRFRPHPSGTPRFAALAVSLRRSRCTRHRSPRAGAKEPWHRGYRDVLNSSQAARSGRGPAARSPVAGPACDGIGHRRDAWRTVPPAARPRWRSGVDAAVVDRQGPLWSGRSAWPAMTAPRRLPRAPRALRHWRGRSSTSASDVARPRGQPQPPADMGVARRRLQPGDIVPGADGAGVY